MPFTKVVYIEVRSVRFACRWAFGFDICCSVHHPLVYLGGVLVAFQMEVRSVS